MENNITQYKFKNNLKQEFEILNISNLQSEFSVNLTIPHRIEFYQILWITEGFPTHIIDFKPIKLQPNTILFINKSSVQSFDNEISFKGYMILFTDNFFCKTIADKDYLKHSILFNDLLSISKIDISDANSIFTNLFNSLKSELQNHKDAYQGEIIHNNLKNFLLQSERIREKEGYLKIKDNYNLDLVLAFKELLEINFVAHKNVIFYCEQMHMTSKRLNNATKRIFGKSPKELINDKIILETKRLLIQSNMSIKEISLSMGFEEPTNFIKYFKKHQKLTPLQFRKEYVMS